MHVSTGGVTFGAAAFSASSRIEQLAEILSRVTRSSIPDPRDEERGAVPSVPFVRSPCSRLHTVSASFQTV
jgi:hypothetical protein